MPTYLTEDLVAAAKRSEFFPISTSALEDSDLIAFANDGMKDDVVPLILSVRQEFFEKEKLITLQSSKRRYDIPTRAIGNALVDLFYVPDVNDTDKRYPITKKSAHEMGKGLVRHKYSFRFQGDEVLLTPLPSGVGSSERLLFLYASRPNHIVAVTGTAKITAVSTSGTLTTFTVNTDLTSSLSAGSLVDVINGQSPFMTLAESVAISSITSTTIVLTLADIKDELGVAIPGVGDYICKEFETPIPTIPIEFHPYLAETICKRAMKAVAASPNLDRINERLDQLRSSALIMIRNRVQEEVDVVYDSDGITEVLVGGNNWSSGNLI